ncbi:hypothetical protein [Nocardioides panacisoli]|uniref:Uncharacterized protein n=1 Tax=Nocardioides panacisoli TaxID=627624 RepID=A0ABP7J254_9ACTN
MKIRTTAVAFVSCLALGAVAAPVAAQADDDAPCATQQAQLDRATAKLADLQAKFAAHPTMKNGKAKKAQAKRVEHAQERLDTCMAAQA